MKEGKRRWEFQDVLSPRELSKKWGVTVYSLCRWRKDSIGPIHFVVGGRVFYKLSEIEAWEDNKGEE